jgi:ketosteroid isomerase-like protein
VSTQTDNLTIARHYLEALENGVTGEALAEYYAPDVVQEEFPNRLAANGARRDLAAILEGAERALASGDQVALEVLWVGTLAVPMGSIPVGGEMRAHFAVFLDFRDGKIVGQRNYDCFEPW